MKKYNLRYIVLLPCVAKKESKVKKKVVSSRQNGSRRRLRWTEPTPKFQLSSTYERVELPQLSSTYEQVELMVSMLDAFCIPLRCLHASRTSSIFPSASWSRRNAFRKAFDLHPCMICNFISRSALAKLHLVACCRSRVTIASVFSADSCCESQQSFGFGGHNLWPPKPCPSPVTEVVSWKFPTFFFGVK